MVNPNTMKEAQIAPQTTTTTARQGDNSAMALPAPGVVLLVQPKLLVGHPDDPLEHEADRAADRVVSLWQGGGFSAPPAETPPQPATPLIQRRATSPAAGAVQASPQVTQQIQSAQGGGQALPAALKPSLEAAFGMDFSGVRLHTDARADALNRDLQARAFTTGRDIFFRQGAYQPGTAEGVRLLGHELGHVGQQGGQFTLIQRTPDETDARIEEALEGFYHEFSSMLLISKWTQNEVEMQAPISVRPPYFMNDSGNNPAEATVNRATRARQNRANSSDFQSLHISGNVLTGKGTLYEIRDVAQRALDRRIVRPNGQPTANDMRDWLERFGIGIDCSGFVSQSLNRVMARVYGNSTNPIRGGSTRLRQATTTVSRPSDLRPGDIMHHPGHIRILRHVEKTPNEVTFTTIESHSSMYSGYDATTFHGDRNSFGLDQAIWRYPNPAQFQSLERQNSSGQFERVKRSDEHATYGRHPRLTEINDAPGATRQQVRSDTISTQTQPAQQQSVFDDLIGGARVLGDWGSERIAASGRWFSQLASETSEYLSGDVSHNSDETPSSTSPDMVFSLEETESNLQTQPANSTRSLPPGRRRRRGWEYGGGNSRQFMTMKLNSAAAYFEDNNYPELATAARTFLATSEREGRISAINTWDAMVLTWGVGFTYVNINRHIWPHLNDAVKSYLITAAPHYFTSIGIQIGDRRAIRTDTSALSALVYVAENDPFRENVLMAQLYGFMTGTMGIVPADVQTGRRYFVENPDLVYWFAQLRHYSPAGFDTQRDGREALQIAGGSNIENYSAIMAASVKIMTRNLLRSRNFRIEENGRYILNPEQAIIPNYIERWNKRLNSFNQQRNNEHGFLPTQTSSITPCFNSSIRPFLTPTGQSLDSIPLGHMTVRNGNHYFDLGEY